MGRRARIVLYSLSPICPRCVEVDELLDLVCREQNVLLDRKGLLLSIWHCVITLSRPPVIVVGGRRVCRGRVPTVGEIGDWLRDR